MGFRLYTSSVNSKLLPSIFSFFEKLTAAPVWGLDIDHNENAAFEIKQAVRRLQKAFNHFPAVL